MNNVNNVNNGNLPRKKERKKGGEMDRHMQMYW